MISLAEIALIMIPVFWNIRQVLLILKSGVGFDVEAIFYICKVIVQNLCN